MSEFTASKNQEGITSYTLTEDPRFVILADTKASALGVGDMVFGQVVYGDGSLKVTGWWVQVDGAPVRFSMGRKLVDRKNNVLDPVWREWALERAAARKAS